VPENYFDHQIAETYEAKWPHLFEPSHHYWVEDGQLEVFSAPFRYVWPSELDLMARLAGMTLRERWSGWDREPFTGDSTAHVSVWEKTA